MAAAADLLPHLRPLVATLSVDLTRRAADPGVEPALREEHATELEARRTADPFSVWVGLRAQQIAAAWVLSALFVRALEDRGLIAPELKRAPDRRALLQSLFPWLDDRDLLRLTFEGLRANPALHAVFDAAHNPIWTLSPSAEGARALVDAMSDPHGIGGLDLSGETRWLGDVYERLDDGVRERFALLQTPDFIEDFLLDQALSPAIAEATALRMVSVLDPTCGSGHLLVGAFRRMFRAHQEADPRGRAETHARLALASVHGIDINPYAAAIARFRLLLAWVDAVGLRSLSDLAALDPQVGAGDSLLEAAGGEAGGGLFAGLSDDARGSVVVNPAWMPQSPAVRRILAQGRRFTVVVGNPPYITVKDPVLNAVYREKYPRSATGLYQLVTPFVERFFQFAEGGGHVAMIVGNGFMKRNFGASLIENVLPGLDLQMVVDTSGAYIPGHGTPTVILLGCSQPPCGPAVRAVMGKRGEPTTPDDPRQGKVWSAIRDHHRDVGYDDDYISVVNMERATLSKHPWSLKGGGAAALQDLIESIASHTLASTGAEIGRTTHTGLDPALIVNRGYACRVAPDRSVALIRGEDVRDWSLSDAEFCLFPYSSIDASPIQPTRISEQIHYWTLRTVLRSRVDFGRTLEERGMQWWEHSMFFPQRFLARRAIAFAFVATHNHFIIDRGGKVFKQSAPIIKLPTEATEDEHLALLGYLNSSLACFWMKQVSHEKSSASQRHHPDPERYAYEFAGTSLEQIPIPDKLIGLAAISHRIDAYARLRAAASNMQGSLGESRTEDSVRNTLCERWKVNDRIREQMITLQEELDWQVYFLFGICSADLLGPVESWLATEVPSTPRGQRPFEIFGGRKSYVRRDHELVAVDEAEVRSVTVLDEELLRLYRDRAAALKFAPLALLESPLYKRQWRDTDQNTIESKYREEEDIAALTQFLLDRAEANLRDEAELCSLRSLARRLSDDPAVMAAAAVLSGERAPDLALVLGPLVEAKSVPALAALRYSDAGLLKRREWEKTWEAQRAEDAWAAADPATRGPAPPAPPLPPKYGSGDFKKPSIWTQRGKLDVPKERFWSLPAVDAGGLRVGWAGWDAPTRMAALAAAAEAHPEPEVQTPTVATMLELLPELLQWWGEDRRYGEPLREVWPPAIESLRLGLGLSEAALRDWCPAGRGRPARAPAPATDSEGAPPRRGRPRKAAAPPVEAAGPTPAEVPQPSPPPSTLRPSFHPEAPAQATLFGLAPPPTPAAAFAPAAPEPPRRGRPPHRLEPGALEALVRPLWPFWTEGVGRQSLVQLSGAPLAAVQEAADALVAAGRWALIKRRPILWRPAGGE